MSCGDYIALLAVFINIVGILVSAAIYAKTVKREQKIITLNEFSRIREQYPNLSPKAPNPVSDSERKNYLREMERFCVGVNSNVYDFHIIRKMSGHLLIKQYDSYLLEFLTDLRSQSDEDWKYCQYEEFINKLKKETKE